MESVGSMESVESVGPSALSKGRRSSKILDSRSGILVGVQRKDLADSGFWIILDSSFRFHPIGIGIWILGFGNST